MFGGAFEITVTRRARPLISFFAPCWLAGLRSAQSVLPMPKKKKWKEPELPWSLQDELNPDRVRDAKAPKKKAVGPSRKQMRKEARKQKKVRPRPPGRPKSEPEPEPEPGGA